jgi:hypothetical protein
LKALVAADAARKRPWPDNAEGNRGNRRRKQGLRCTRHRLHRRHCDKALHPRQRNRSECHEPGRCHKDRALGRSCIHQRPCRRLRQQRGDAAHGHDDADGRFAPPLNSQQVDRQIGAEAIANIGKEEVERVEASPDASLRIGHQNGPLKTKKAPSAISAKPAR